jgi:hypothetical protein
MSRRRHKDKVVLLFFVFILLIIIGVIVQRYAFPKIDTILSNNTWIVILLGVLGIGIIVFLLYKVVKRIITWFKSLFGVKGTKGHRTSIPTSVEKNVLARAHHCCQYPFCWHHDNLQIHHIDKNPSNHGYYNLIVLCPNHHSQAGNNMFRKDSLTDWCQKDNYLRNGKVNYGYSNKRYGG